MTKWNVFSQTEKDFESKENYDNYMKATRCAICHKSLKVGEEFDMRAIQTIEETRKFNDSDFTSLAVIVHRKCVEK